MSEDIGQDKIAIDNEHNKSIDFLDSEDLEEIGLFDEANAEKGDLIPFEQAIAEIESAN